MRFARFALSLALLGFAAPALAANVDVQLLNKGEKGAMVFQPDLVKIAVGDTISFQAVDKGHDVEGIAAMMPAGAAPFKGQISKDFAETFAVPGVYAVKCDPHYGLGMVAVIVVGGDLSNLDAVKAAKNPKKAQERFDAIFAELQK